VRQAEEAARAAALAQAERLRAIAEGREEPEEDAGQPTSTPTPLGGTPTPEPAIVPTPAPWATPTPYSSSPGPSLPQIQGNLISRGLTWLRNLRNVSRSSAVTFNELESGHLSIRVSPRIAVGDRIALRQDFDFQGTRYNPSTIRDITAWGRIRAVFSRANLGLGLIASVAANAYDYTLGEHRGEGLGRGFWVSTGVDFAVSVGTGLAAASLVAGGVALLGLAGITAPLWAAVAGTAIVGAGVTYILDRTGAVDALKDRVSQGLDAWLGVWDNIGTIARVLPGYVGDTVLRPAAAAIQERVVQPIVQAAQAVSGAVRDAAVSVGEAVSGFFGRTFGGGG